MKSVSTNIWAILFFVPYSLSYYTIRPLQPYLLETKASESKISYDSITLIDEIKDDISKNLSSREQWVSNRREQWMKVVRLP